MMSSRDHKTAGSETAPRTVPIDELRDVQTDAQRDAARQDIVEQLCLPDPEAWLRAFYPDHVTALLAPHHRELWDWVWGLDPQLRPRPFVAVWARGGAKSTSAELACVALGARASRSYGMYVCQSQSQA